MTEPPPHGWLGGRGGPPARPPLDGFKIGLAAIWVGVAVIMIGGLMKVDFAAPYRALNETIAPPKHRLCYPKKGWAGLDRDRPCAYRMLKSGKVVVKTADGRRFFPVPPPPTFKGNPR